MSYGAISASMILPSPEQAEAMQQRVAGAYTEASPSAVLECTTRTLNQRPLCGVVGSALAANVNEEIGTPPLRSSSGEVRYP
jgi:hypothetical protein